MKAGGMAAGHQELQLRGSTTLAVTIRKFEPATKEQDQSRTQSVGMQLAHLQFLLIDQSHYCLK